MKELIGISGSAPPGIHPVINLTRDRVSCTATVTSPEVAIHEVHQSKTGLRWLGSLIYALEFGWGVFARAEKTSRPASR
jgi:hypothetical protein